VLHFLSFFAPEESQSQRPQPTPELEQSIYPEDPNKGDESENPISQGNTLDTQK
jgi:hypothetical protein